MLYILEVEDDDEIVIFHENHASYIGSQPGQDLKKMNAEENPLIIKASFAREIGL
jgi:hypothetical protein